MNDLDGNRVRYYHERRAPEALAGQPARKGVSNEARNSQRGAADISAAVAEVRAELGPRRRHGADRAELEVRADTVRRSVSPSSNSTQGFRR
jgi:hypothetical protein